MSCISGVLISLGLVAVLTTDIGYGHEDNWQLIFHAVKGNGQSVLNAWNTKAPPQCTPNNGCLPPGFKLDHWRDNAKHLRSPLIDQWESLSIKKIRVELGGQGKTLAFLEFDGSGSNDKDWFSKSRLLHSSWADLKTAKTNHFSIRGDERDRNPIKRHFFVNQRYAGCPNDFGWFVVLDRTNEVCSWAKKGKAPAFLYSRGSQVVNWNQSPGVADVMNVYIQAL
ncbi:uncharacterized protein LOC125675913 isoform X2 [Ostrea edulis]|uniref:uncharacterized protein LOC125675913 isoform X2 n=1 Tax=Ostrea edulis TaxID=37623 RepID=UPI0024AF44EA|nr:uncharacterized protein LOC125675913 isoform X2 [Ostrea edulis]